MSHDTIATRIVLILQRLNSGERLSLVELSKEFNVSLRTLQRDFNERLNFMPIDVDNGYYSLPSYCLGSLTFSDARELLFSVGTDGLYPKLTNNFLVDLLNKNLNNSISVEGYSYENIALKEKEFFLINLAIIKGHQLSLEYKAKKRLLKPYKLFNTQGIWYLIADEDGILKNFSFTKIEKLKLLKNSSFTKEKRFIEQIESKTTRWVTNSQIEIILEIDSSVVEYFTRRELLKNYKVLKTTQEYTRISATASYEQEILSLVQYWIPHIIIIEPQHLQEKMLEVLDGYILKINKKGTE